MFCELDHHASVISSTLETPDALHPFSIVLNALCAIAEVMTLVVNSVLPFVLFYEVEVVWLA